MSIIETMASAEPLAAALIDAIRSGNVSVLQRLFTEHPSAARVRITDDCGNARSLLHIATDWPGHFPNCAQTIASLVASGADVNAPFMGAHSETPLHWAASADDVDALDALLDAGAAIEATGGVIGGGTPLDDAVAFAQWNAACRLVARGAATSLGNAAALGLIDRVAASFAGDPPAQPAIDLALWLACHGGQRETAEYLLDRGADPNWLPPWERVTPLDGALRNNFPELAEWLRGQGGTSADEIG